MTGNIAVFVTDQRQKNLAEYLPGKKVLLDWHNTQKKGAVEELVENCGYFIFPTPVSKLNRYPKLEDMLKYELINEKHEDKTVIGGAFTDKWIEYLQQHKISYFDLMKDENVVQKNAHITAEATVAEILKYSAYSIYGQKIIVCGYGRCGKSVADLLAAMGAKVTILARSAKARQMARGNGHEAVDFSYGPEEVYGARTIVNTVPAQVIREPMIQEMHKDTVIIDIASRPGGVDLVAAERQEIKSSGSIGTAGNLYDEKQCESIRGCSYKSDAVAAVQRWGKNMDLSNCNIGYGITGSFCTFTKTRKQIVRLKEMGANVIPIFSYQAQSCDTRFGSAKRVCRRNL